MTGELRIQGLSVRCGSRWLLHEVSLELPSRGVVALMGSGGAGKSTLLRCLAGELRSSGALEITGGLEGLRGEVGLVLQRPALLATSVLEYMVSRLPHRSLLTRAAQRGEVSASLAAAGQRGLADRLDEGLLSLTMAERRLLAILRELGASPAMLCVDEPTVGLSEAEAEEVLSLLEAEGQRRLIFMASHHQAYCRRLASQVVLLAAGRVVECSPSPSFFEQPATAAGASFILTGGCAIPSVNATLEEVDPSWEPWVASAAPRQDAPSARLGPEGFCWSLPGQLAGTPMPGLLRSLGEDKAALQRVGVTTLVTLTEQPLAPEVVSELGLEALHLPIVDMQAPGFEEAVALCAEIERRLQRGEVIAVHCKAGLGRTGVILAALRVVQGASAAAALTAVRQLKATWVQSQEQESFLEGLERHLLASRGDDGSGPRCGVASA